MTEIFKAIVGSQSYGTSTPTSDIDYKGVYMQTTDELIGFGYKEQYEVGKDESYYEVRRFLQLLSTGNPTVLELLWSPEDCVLVNTPQFKLIQEHRDKFLTKKCKMSFGGYAIEQIKKAKGLNKKQNWDKERMVRKDVLDFCFVLEGEMGTTELRKYLVKEGRKAEHFGLCKLNHFRDTYAIFYDYQAEMRSTNPKFESAGYGYRGIATEGADDVHTSSIPKFALRDNVMFFNRDAYSVHCKEYKEFLQWKEEHNEQRYVDVKGHGQKIDGKNMLHCQRLLDMASEIALNRTITVKRPNAEYLLSIRRGEVDLNKLIKQVENKIILLDDLFDKSDLPDEVSRDFVNELLLEIRHL